MLKWKLNFTVGTQVKIRSLVFCSMEVKYEFLDSVILTIQGTRAISPNVNEKVSI